MPKRTDIKTILIIGSGPIIIGQACEFDYSGTQACKALREESYRIVLVNSNPATIMTDPEFADVTYIEPLTPEILGKIIARERPDALLPTLGGQTALNLSCSLARNGCLDRYGVELIGAKIDAIKKGEDRELFRAAMQEIGLDVPASCTVRTIEQACAVQEDVGNFPLIIRPSFTLGGTGGGIAYNREEYERIVAAGLEASPVHEVLVEECLVGWKEYEMEVMRDHKDQCVVICAIENIDAMGVHTGDSITVAPTMTLSDKEYQLMRDAAFACIRAVGVETGGSNVQFALDPCTGRLVIIEMNPRVSRSSALASKATGFPIAKIAALLAVGYALDELRNDITRETPASFEPTLDYVVTKIPRFTFEKFSNTDNSLTSAMKSVGEVMAIGRTFKESLQKALRSLEIGVSGLGDAPGKKGTLHPIGNRLTDYAAIRSGLAKATPERLFYIRYAVLAGFSIEDIHAATHIDPWFLEQIRQIIELEKTLAAVDRTPTPEMLRYAKTCGFTDLQIAELTRSSPEAIRKLREAYGISTTYHLVDTCAAEFQAFTPYFYSSYGDENELHPTKKKKILIIGGGPNRIGQGIEFDYCCVHACLALREDGYETLMINSNPETVSTDYDISDRLYFDPLTLEDVLEVCRQENPQGAIVQFGGQTPLNLAVGLKANGVPIIGTAPEDIDAAEDRERFKRILEYNGLHQPLNATALNEAEAHETAERIGFPILLRPSFVLGGRGMFIVYGPDELHQVVKEAFAAAPGKPVLIDKFLEDALEVDVDCLSDGTTTVIAGMLEHIEHAGVHSGDAAMVFPPRTLDAATLDALRTATHILSRALNVVGLLNVQYAIKDGQVYVLEANPRASRTVPFVSKAIGVPLAQIAARVMAGKSLHELGFTSEVNPSYWAVKESVFPFARFPGSPVILGPEMRSTGEVMGLDADYGLAFAKTQMAVQLPLPTEGNVFISVKERDKPAAVALCRDLINLGFTLYATSGTTAYLKQHTIPVNRLHKLTEGRPNVVDMIKNNMIAMVINTPSGMLPHIDENVIRSAAVKHSVCMMTTLNGAYAAVLGIKALKNAPLEVCPLQEHLAAFKTS